MSSSPVVLGAVGALISAVSAGVALALRLRSRERLVALNGASDDMRARVVADAVVMFQIPVEGLTNQQRFDLVKAQLEDRDRQRRRSFLLALALMTLLAGTTLALALHDRRDADPTDSKAAQRVLQRNSEAESSEGQRAKVLVPSQPHISGLVADQQDNPLAGAIVKVVGTQFSSATGASGDFRFSLDANTGQQVRLSVSKDGFVPLSEYYPPTSGVRVVLRRK